MGCVCELEVVNKAVQLVCSPLVYRLLDNCEALVVDFLDMFVAHCALGFRCRVEGFLTIHVNVSCCASS